MECEIEGRQKLRVSHDGKLLKLSMGGDAYDSPIEMSLNDEQAAWLHGALTELHKGSLND